MEKTKTDKQKMVKKKAINMNMKMNDSERVGEELQVTGE